MGFLPPSSNSFQSVNEFESQLQGFREPQQTSFQNFPAIPEIGQQRQETFQPRQETFQPRQQTLQPRQESFQLRQESFQPRQTLSQRVPKVDDSMFDSGSLFSREVTVPEDSGEG